MIILTEKAEEYITDQLTERGYGIGIRFGVIGAGCGGYTHTVEFVDEIDEFDVEFTHNKTKIIVDKKSLPLIDGMEVDFITTGFSSGMSFKLPGAISCGCGESFSI